MPLLHQPLRKAKRLAGTLWPRDHVVRLQKTIEVEELLAVVSMEVPRAARQSSGGTAY